MCAHRSVAPLWSELVIILLLGLVVPRSGEASMHADSPPPPSPQRHGHAMLCGNIAVSPSGRRLSPPCVPPPLSLRKGARPVLRRRRVDSTTANRVRLSLFGVHRCSLHA
jgi:hypothetical protein